MTQRKEKIGDVSQFVRVGNLHLQQHVFVTRDPMTLHYLGSALGQLDLLLLTVAKPRRVHPDGIHFQGFRYLDTTLAAAAREWSLADGAVHTRRDQPSAPHRA